MRELALAMIGMSLLLSWVNMGLTFRMVGRINAKLPTGEQMTLPFVRSDWKTLHRQYAEMYPGGDLHLKIRGCPDMPSFFAWQGSCYSSSP